MKDNLRIPIILFPKNCCGPSRQLRKAAPTTETAFGQAGGLIAGKAIRLAATQASIILISFVLLLTARTAPADEIVLTTGERFTSSRVWQEDGKLRFDMQGLIVSVNLEDVSEVIREDDPHPSRAAETPAGQAPPTSQAIPPAQATPHEPATVNEPSQSDPRDAVAPESNHKGIGFDGLAWQMEPHEIPGIKKLKTDPAYGGIDQYWRPDGNLSWGKAALDGLIFGFWRDRLYSIMFWVNGKPAYGRLQQAAFQYYGQGHKNPQGLERYVWFDETTDRMLEFDRKSNTGIFWMRSRELDSQIKKLYPE